MNQPRLLTTLSVAITAVALFAAGALVVACPSPQQTLGPGDSPNHDHDHNHDHNHDHDHDHDHADGEDHGHVHFPNCKIEVRGDYRYVTSNGLPNHETGDFPGRGNPHAISEQDYHFRMPVTPDIADEPTPLGMWPFGVAVNGIVFDPLAAEWWNRDLSSGWQIEALSGAIDLGLDDNNAHVQPDGSYHYHGIPTALVEELGADEDVVLVGYAADGFPIYGPVGYDDAENVDSEVRTMASSYRLKEGSRPGGRDGPGGKYDGTYVQDYEYVEGLGDLDECNGRFGITPEYPDGTYHYYITQAWPVIPRLLKGEPDKSFMRGPGGQGGPGANPNGPGANPNGPGANPNGPGGRRPPPPRRGGPGR